MGLGTLAIEGSGDNEAKLNTGGGGLTILNRSGGSAVSQVKINGGGETTVRLAASNQIAGANGSAETVVFGHRGGRLDLYGQDASWAGITHLDRDAQITNNKENSTSTFTFTGSGEQTYLGKFSDGGNSNSGLLNVVYDGGSSSEWTLHGDITNAGTWTIASGSIQVLGRPTILAADRIDDENWERASFATGTVAVNQGAEIFIGKDADVSSNFSVLGTVTVSAEGGSFTGDVALNSAQALLAVAPGEAKLILPGQITGTGTLEKSTAGTLELFEQFCARSNQCG